MWPGFENENGIIVSSFGIMMFLAFVSCNFFIRRTLKEKKINPKIGDDIIFWAAIGGIIGAKLYYYIEFGFSELPEGASIWDIVQNFGSGLVFYGGLIGGFFSVTLYIYVKKLSWLEYADIVAPLLALGHSIGRLGCFLVHDCDGVESKYNFFPLAVKFPDMHVHLYPTQIYEMLAYLSIFLYLYSYRHKVNFKGELFFEYLFLVGISRFLIEFIRSHEYLNSSGEWVESFNMLGLYGAQHISLIMIIAGIGFHYYLRLKK